MRKKLFTIIMSVMMVAVFMPSMAFATTEPVEAHSVHASTSAWTFENVQYSDDYSQVTATVVCDVEGCTETLGTVTVPTLRTMTSDGYINAYVAEGSLVTAAKAKFDAYTQNLNFWEPSDVVGSEDGKTYVDLDGATIAFENNDGGYGIDGHQYFSKVLKSRTEADGTVTYYLSKDALLNDLDAKEQGYDKDVKAFVTVKVPTYATNYSADLTSAEFTNNETRLSLADFDLTLFATSYKAYMAPGKYDVPFTLVSEKDSDGTDVVKVLNASKMNNTLKLNIGYPSKVTQSDLAVSFDGKVDLTANDGSTFTTTYNGEAHQFKVDAQNVQVKYLVNATPEVVDSGTDLWTTTAPSFTNAGDYTVQVQVTYTGYKFNTEMIDTDEATYYVHIDPAVVYFNQTQEGLVVGEHYDVQFEDFMTVSGVVAKDLDHFMDLVHARVSATPAMIGVGKVLFVYEDLAVSDCYPVAEAAFLSNYDVRDNGLLLGRYMSNNWTYDVDVNVQETKANNFKQTIAKINAKKGKVKTVQLGVTKAAKGAVTWKKLSGNSKVTVSSTGKLVVKKGLKKGTYKVKVKATAAGNYLYGEGSATRTLKVVVK